jgi:site-specific DNA recombinase
VSGEGKRVAGGKAWDKDAVRRILTNVTYLGKVLYHGEVFDGQHEVIIDQETWDAVQRLLRDHAGVKERRDRTSGALLGGLLRCGICGQAMGHHFAVKKGRRYGSYVCQTIQKQGAAACPGSRVPLRELEGFVVEKIMAIGRDHRLVAETLKAARKQLEARTPEILAELRCHEKDREKLDRERQHLVDAVGKGKASPAILQRLGEQDLLAQSLEAQVAKLKDELAAMESKVIDEADLQAALASFTPVWEELFPAERARILQLLIERVTYDAKAGEVEIVFRPGGVRTLAANAGKETA